MKRKARLGFSLIELSVALLIIALLMVAAIKGSELVSQAKLGIARNKTANSSIIRMNGLVLWLETTMPQSFDDSKIGDNSAIAYWKDLSPIKNNATQSTSSKQPLYISNSINGLPTMKFDGSDDNFVLPDGTVPYGNSSYSVSFVAFTRSFCACALLGSGAYGTANKVNAFRYDTSLAFRNYWGSSDFDSSGNSLVLNKPHILTFIYDGSTRYGYINGAINASLASSNRDSTTSYNTVGSGSSNGNGEFLNGNIAEIVVFNRALSSDELKEVERYLSDKYKITIPS